MARIAQGAAASRNGRAIEKALLPVFTGCGFVVMSGGWDYAQHVQPDDRIIFTNVPYMSIYGSDRSRTEYVICADGRRVRVELKFQASSGSVDEKYPYMLLNAIYAYPEKEVILLVDGGGYKPGARKWLQDQIEGDWLGFREMGKDIQLLDLGGFMVWFMKTFG